MHLPRSQEAVALDASPRRASDALAYEPALDGLRGACVLAVLLFHSGFTWASGGFLGVSTFFTLSGFLITTLLVAERDASGRLSLRRFWERRVRRLLPAALLTVAAVVVSAPLWLSPAQWVRLELDALATLLYVVNWRYVSAEYAYELIFTDPSPLQHFWSLAIEGQFYLVFPLVAGLLLRRGVRALAVACVVLCVASIAVCFTVPTIEEAQHRLYYGTDARAVELLVGALLALLRRSRGYAPWRAAGALPALGVAAALVILLAWSRATVGDAWLYHGGFAGYAVLSALVIAAALQPQGAVRSALSARWLRWVGEVSYGAYLFHWPIFMLLSAERTGLPAPALFALRLAVTLALAGLSYRFLERPVRRASVLPGRRLAWASVLALLLVAAAAVVTSPISIPVQAVIARNMARAALGLEPANARLPRIAMFGDSTAFSLWNGLAAWLRDGEEARPAGGVTDLGCGLFVFGEMEKFGRWAPENKKCHGALERWKAKVVEDRPDVAIVLVGPWEVRNRRRSPDDPPRALGDPVLDAATRDAIVAAVEALTESGASVVWLTSPHIRALGPTGKPTVSEIAASEPARIDRLNELIREVAREYPDRMRVVDLARHMQERPEGEFDVGLRHDFVHFSPEGALRVSQDWLGPEVLRAVRELRQASASARAD
ncbi:MAG TPA: acyltransferase family protein [Candidatus Binatia bacterium]